ncbi:TnsA endonuclease N-terminal domain-containing protein [Streptomyces europaeiscabiei]|uniref:TnsA endonuclease N-terminal domain-containing protein n=1 Tax=Streptomyces europaeiscabiei TaxID=146819 RepID=UPI002E17157D
MEGKRRRHIPDYLLVTDDGSVVVDVKPRHRLEDPRGALAFAWTRRAVEARGWAYEVCSEPPPAEGRRHAAECRALTCARRLARQNYQYPDDRLAIALLLKRWQLGLGTSLAERRITLRLSREQTLPLPSTWSEDTEIAILPSVSRVLAPPMQAQPADEDVAVERLTSSMTRTTMTTCSTTSTSMPPH